MKTMKKALAFGLGLAIAASCAIGLGAPIAQAATATEGLISGYAWIDANKNGLRDSGEAAYPGVGVLVEQKGADDKWSIASLGANQTDAEGKFAFRAPPGTYRVRFYGYDTKMYGPTTYQLNNGAYPLIDSDVKAAEDQPNTLLTDDILVEANKTYMIGMGVKSSFGGIKGFAFLDVSPINHKYDVGNDQLLAGVTVAVYASNDLDNIVKVDGSELKAVTNANGEYVFKYVPEGNYVLRFTIPASHAFCTYNLSAYTPGVDAKTDSKAMATTNTQVGQTAAFTVYSGMTVDYMNVGCYALNSISGMVFIDRNQDGMRADAGEEGVQGYEVQLLKSDKTAVLDANGSAIIARTNANGNYYFGGLPAGDYRLLFKKQLNNTFSEKCKAGVPVELNSDVDADGYTDVMTLSASGSHYQNIDAGIIIAGMGPLPTATPADGETPKPTTTGKYGDMTQTGENISGLLLPLIAGGLLLAVGGGILLRKKFRKHNG